MGGGKYKPQEYVVGEDPYINQEDVVMEKDLGDYTNVPQEVIDKEGTLPTEDTTTKVTTDKTKTVGAARGLQL
jgi:hypothetical protein